MKKTKHKNPRKMCKQIMSLISAFILCCSVFTIPTFAAKTEQDYENEINKLENQIQKNKDETAINDKNIDKKIKQINLQQEQLNIYNKKVTNLSRQINQKNKLIQDYQIEIETLNKNIGTAEENEIKAKKKIDEAYSLLAERIRSAYIAGETSTLEVLLTSKDFETFLTRIELLKRVSDNDSRLVENFKTSVQEYQNMQKILKENKNKVALKQEKIKNETEEIEAVRTREEAVKNTVIQKQNVLQNEADKLYAYQDNLENKNENLNNKLEKAKEEYLEFKAAQMEHGSGDLDVGGNSDFTQSKKGMIFPLQYSNAYINCGWMGYAGHKGIDMITRGATGNTYGKEIRAVADGVVYSAERHWSWGNNVYINHGNGVYTRYAHTSRMLVSPGQHVKQGQVIAYVGNTGNVYPRPSKNNPHAGAHLHFEVWVNGYRTNPSPWIPKGPDK